MTPRKCLNLEVYMQPLVCERGRGTCRTERMQLLQLVGFLQSADFIIISPLFFALDYAFVSCTPIS